MKALITFTADQRERRFIDFPITPASIAYWMRDWSIDLDTEEEYKLVYDFVENEYLIPAIKLEEWEAIQLYSSYPHEIPQEYRQYKIQGNWDDFKITKK